MEHNLENLKLKDLQEICKKYNLKTYGKKSDIVKRIRDHEIAQIEHIEVALTATDSNTNENDESKMDNLELDNVESSDEGELVDVLDYNQSHTKSDTSCETVYQKETNSNKRIAVKTFFHLTSEYEDRESALSVIQDEYYRVRMSNTKEGQKERFACKYSGCNKKCYILYTLNNATLSLWFNDQEHNHDEANIKEKKEWGINLTTKEAIDKLFRAGTKSAGKILSVLRIYQQETIKDKDNKSISNPDFISNIVLPTSRQITNYVNNTLKPKVVVVNFNYANLTKWVENHLNVPESEDEIFVIDSVINIVYHYQQKN
jgi:hypothetical protein